MRLVQAPQMAEAATESARGSKKRLCDTTSGVILAVSVEVVLGLRAHVAPQKVVGPRGRRN